MRKILIFILIIFCFYLFSKDEVYIGDNESIRFRVIANSNSAKDIMIKELVIRELSFLFSDSSIENTRERINDNLDNIKQRISDLFIQNEYDKNFNVLYGMNEFPQKEYNGIVYDEGMYESLVIEIGEAKGDNYWCFLYPSLCMIDLKEDAKYKSKFLEFINNILM